MNNARCILSMALWGGLPMVGSAGAPVDFVREVRPLFEQHCVKCHGPEKQRGGLRLDVKKAALAGGEEHGPDIIPGDSERSPLVRLIESPDADHRMPKNGPALSGQATALIKRWINEGAVWPDSADATRLGDAADWWSLRPLRKPPVPTPAAGSLRNPVDAFVLERLKKEGLAPGPEADRRTLIRRLSFDLLGLPPSPEAVAAFVDDPDPLAYERMVDRFLESPRYGERWARHWLDVVHYGETHGYDKDKPRPNAWPYRDYVIRSFNEDKPYARFVREQIAGDVLYPGTVDGIVALGFVAAGPWDYIGHAEVPETKTDGKVARHLDRDDMVQNTVGTFCSLTVQCAQCHNHKFDPISMRDYYSLQAVFAAVDRADKPYFEDADLTKRYVTLQWRQKVLSQSLKTLEDEAVKRAGPALAALETRIANAAKAVRGNGVPESGYHSAIAPSPDVEKWVQLDLGRSVQLGEILLAPCYDDYAGIGGGFGFPRRFKIEVGDDPEFRSNLSGLVQLSQEDVPNPGTRPQTFDARGKKGRFLRVTALKLAERKNDFIFALAEIRVSDADGKTASSGAVVTSLDSIESGPRWARKNLLDGHYPGLLSGAKGPENLAGLRADREKMLAAALSGDQRKSLAQVREELTEVAASLGTFPKPNLVYAATVHYGSGAFSGTGPNGGKPREIHMLKRGDVKSTGDLVDPGAVTELGNLFDLPAHFELPAGAGEEARRAALANWIADKKNPLTWRSIVNRVWQYHFGKAMVDTSNDFGRMGGLPSHPELLDWLAATFRDDFEGSWKKLHRLIVTSQTYCQTSLETAGQEAALRGDADNRLLWRQNRRKLEAEAVHDAILQVSGKLRDEMGGPSYQDFVIEKPEHSPHYEYQLHDPEDPACHRRSIYRFIVRSQQQPFMTTMDCADPSMRVDKRNESISPLQALSMMNNDLTVSMAKHFAERVEAESADLESCVARAFELALGRSPAAEERQALADYAANQGLANACRLILNLNEFSFVD